MIKAELKAKIQELLQSKTPFACIKMSQREPQLILGDSVEKFTITSWKGERVSIDGEHESREVQVESHTPDLTHIVRVNDLTFDMVNSPVLRGKLHKAVLARTFGLKGLEVSWPDVAEELWNFYPRSLGYIFYTPETGAWLGSTPEILFYAYPDGEFYTHALAGTLLKYQPWDEKNLEEQRMVSDFISRVLSEHGLEYKREDDSDLHYGEIKHRVSMFRGKLPEGFDIQSLLSDLAPTPAVAGMPRDLAVKQIDKREYMNRGCYGGYMTLEDGEGGSYSFVTIRCVHFDPFSGDAAIYAGGGITSKSEPQAELEETYRKAWKLNDILRREN